MKASPLHNIIYKVLFPQPRPDNPANFAEHLTNKLIPEVRTETAAFYGPLDCAEARYPGLDYTYTPHRRRLSRFKYHRALFHAFDDLGLNDQEILSLCRWEGTRWARERYEIEEGIKVIDTAGTEIPDWIEPATAPVVRIHHSISEPAVSKPEKEEDQSMTEDHGSETEEAEQTSLGSPLPGFESTVDEPMDGESDTEDVQSIGLALNERLRAAAAARDQGASVRMDEEWEQWMKEVVERGVLPALAPRIPTGAPQSSISASGTSISSTVPLTGDCPPRSDPSVGTAPLA